MSSSESDIPSLSTRVDADDAITRLEASERDAPLDVSVQRALAAAYEASGDTLRAAAARLAAIAMAETQPLYLFNLATAYMQRRQLAVAEKWFRVTLAMAPDLAAAMENLASILSQTGRADEGRRMLHAAYTRQWLFVERACDSQTTILLCCAGGIGNIPIDFILPVGRHARVRCIVDYASPAAVDALPPHDLCFNLIGDADVPAATDARLTRLVQLAAKPVLNRPEFVAHTRRDRLAERLQGISDVVIPTTLRVSTKCLRVDAIIDALAQGVWSGPIILRPAQAHGGQGVMLAHNDNDIRRFVAGCDDVVYATAYCEYRSADGYFRKYRMIFVDGRAYPYHLAISRHWLVHYFSADMTETPWKRDEERRFLDNPASVLGDGAIIALSAIGRRMSLEYGGIDFGVLPDGRILVFEANATMLVHGETAVGPLAYKHPHAAAIADAVEQMIRKRLTM